MPFTQISGSQILDQSMGTSDFAENSLEAKVIKDGTIVDAKIVTVSADKITVADTGNKYAAGNVEDALQEVAGNLYTQFTQLNSSISTAKSDIESQLNAQSDLFNSEITATNNNITNNIQNQLNNLESGKAEKNGDASQNFNAFDINVAGSILPMVNGTQNIGSSAYRFGTIFVNEARLSTNTLYIGDTPVLGTANNTIEIKADTNQSVTVSTSGSGITTVSSETGVNIATTGMNADVKIQASGVGADVRLTAEHEVSIQGTNVVVTGPMAVSGAISTGGDLTVTGNFTVNGTTTTVNTTTLAVTDNIIEVNKGQTGNGVTAGQAGIKVDRGDGAAYFMVFDEISDMFKVGMAGQLETIASQNWVNARAYVHPVSHPASIITEETDKRFMKDSERSKLENGRQVQAGQSNFASLGSFVKITLPTSILDTNYFVSVTPCESTDGNLGEMWVEKSVGSFKVYNTGSAINKFDWIVMY